MEIMDKIIACLSTVPKDIFKYFPFQIGKKKWQGRNFISHPLKIERKILCKNT